MKRLIQKENAKNYDDLYHYTDLAKLYNILKTDTLLLSENHGTISFTRNSNFHFYNRSIGSNLECRLNLDGTKLTENIKIKPYHDSEFLGKDDVRKPWSTENEEICKSNINGIKQYIKGITIYKETVDMRIFNQRIRKYLSKEEYQYWKEQDPMPDLTKEIDDWFDDFETNEPHPAQKWQNEHPEKDLTFEDAMTMIKSVWQGGVTIV